MAEIGLGHGLFTVAGDECRFIVCFNVVASAESRAASWPEQQAREKRAKFFYPFRASMAHENALIALSHHLGTPSTFDAGHPQAL